jgi:hypothetical protein
MHIPEIHDRWVEIARTLLREENVQVHKGGTRAYIQVGNLKYGTEQERRVKRLMRQNGFLLCHQTHCERRTVENGQIKTTQPNKYSPQLLEYHLTESLIRELQWQEDQPPRPLTLLELFP